MEARSPVSGKVFSLIEEATTGLAVSWRASAGRAPS